MKVKDLERTANIAWSPASQHPILLAAGTAAQQLDASFNTNAALEIYELNLNDPSPDLELKATIPSEQRFHRVAWNSYGRDNNGTIVGGCDGGIIQVYNASKLLNNENGTITKQSKHTGPVHSLDFNPFQSNLLATGASESEIFIWDLNNMGTPMTPGTKSQPPEDVLYISWNRQVQHILASTFPTKCVVWDLRKNEPIIKLSDTVSRIRWKVVAWHPEVATQLCLASEEDQAPIIQLWDLRFATSPLKTLENHQRGVLSVAWCKQDPDLLISCGKDNRILCWNPNSNQPGGEVLAEVAKTTQWNFDIAWCPRNPALIASPSFDGHVSVYSLMGGKVQQVQTTSKIADSFPGMDGYIQAPVIQQTAVVSVDLSKPPKWLKRPVGASFGFGGKLITFDNDKQEAPQRFVITSQVITELELVNKSTQLEQALEYGNFSEFCRNKADLTTDQHKRYIWYFIKANFEENRRSELLNLLGYKVEDVNARLKQYIGNGTLNEATDQFSQLSTLDAFDQISQEKPLQAPFKIKTGDDMEGLITQALLLGNVEATVELCLKAKRYADAILIAMTGGADLLAKTQLKYLQQSEGYLSSLISALVSEDWGSVIGNCEINSWREALAAALTHSSDDDLPILCEQMGNRLELESRGNVQLEQDAQLCYICAGSFEKLVSSWTKGTKQTSEDLQEVVELVTFLQKAVERQGRNVEITGSLADLLSDYASILASQGNLGTALNYLGTSQDEQVAALRERLYVCLGHKPLGEIQQRKSNPQQSFNNQYTPNYNQFNTGLPVAAPQSWQQNPGYPQPAKPFSPSLQVAPPIQPPRPTSVGSSHGGSGITSRNKYIVDPSVQSNQYGARPSYAPVQPNNFQTNALANTYNPYGSPGNLQSPLMPQSNQFTQSTNQFVPQVNQFVPQANQFAPQANQFVPQANQFVPPPPVQNSPPNFQSGFEQPEVAQSALNTLLPAASGWNDPPFLSKATKMTPKQEFSSQEPITHPIYGSAPTANNGYTEVNQQYGASYGQNQQPPPQMFQPRPGNNFPPTSGFNPSSFNTQATSRPNFNQNSVYSEQQVVPEKPQPIQKPPIPEEHMHMQTVFDELRNKCFCTANNPQTRRKLDDVARKMESLYDLLREHKLSPQTLGALHQMVQLVQQGDYTSGLNLHTQLVSGTDFAQIASFMPGLKVLLQSALQLQVYIQ